MTRLLCELEAAGAHEQATAQAYRLPTAGMFWLFLEQQGQPHGGGPVSSQQSMSAWPMPDSWVPRARSHSSSAAADRGRSLAGRVAVCGAGRWLAFQRARCGTRHLA